MYHENIPSYFFSPALFLADCGKMAAPPSRPPDSSEAVASSPKVALEGTGTLSRGVKLFQLQQHSNLAFDLKVDGLSLC